MKTKSYYTMLFASSFALIFLTQTARCADKKTILEQANRTYFNLKANGLAEFTCQVSPDWDAAFKNVKMDAVGRDKVLPMAKQTTFQVTVGPSGAASISHQFRQAPPSQDVADRLRIMAEGMEQMLSGFFQTWSQLMINPPLAGTDNEYQMEEKSDGYRFTANEANIEVAVEMNRDLVINSIYAKTSEFEGTVHPRFAQHQGGLVVDSYEGTYKTKSGNSQQLSVKIQYQEIESLPLPRIVTMTISLPQGLLEEPIALSDCVVKKK